MPRFFFFEGWETELGVASHLEERSWAWRGQMLREQYELFFFADSLLSVGESLVDLKVTFARQPMVLIRIFSNQLGVFDCIHRLYLIIKYNMQESVQEYFFTTDEH